MSRYLIVLAVAAIAVVGAAHPAVSSTDSKTKKFNRKAVVDSAKNVDNPPSGDSQGDILVFTQKIFRESRKVGTDQVYCVRTIAGEARVCNGIIFLPRGTLTITGSESTSVHSLAITGGTEHWRGARGEIVLRPRGPLVDRMKFYIELG
jgi:allene oxide cyclase